MNRIARIAAATLSIAAAGSAFAESPFFTLEPAAVTAQNAKPSTQPRMIVRGVLHDYVEMRADSAPVSRSRADVRAEVTTALANGELRQPPTAEDAFYPLHAVAKPARTASELMAQAGR